MKRKEDEHREARRLRAELGWSLARIARELGVAKSSVSIWVRGIGTEQGAPARRPAGALPARRLLVWTSGSTRRCGRCRLSLPLELFNRLHEGHQSWCRRCFAEYFRACGELHRHQSRVAKSTRQRALRAHVLEYLRRHPCVDCHEADPVVLEFDHLTEKAGAISELVANTVPLASLESEIGRCEVVCANCHRRRTARRAGWRRAYPTDDVAPPIEDSRVARNIAHVHAILRRSACADCGIGETVLLDFDHIAPKRRSVMQLAWWGSSVATIDAEIACCEIRCANCHRRATAARGGHFRFRVLSCSMPP